MARRAATFASVVVLAMAACTRLEDPTPGTIVTCSTASDCPAGRICNRGRCTNPNALDTTPPDLVGGSVSVTPARGRAGQAFTVTVQVSEPLEQPPAVALAVSPPIVLACAASGTLAYACLYTATGAENDGRGGALPIDVRLVDLAGNETARTGAGVLELDFLPPVLAARSVEPRTVRLGAVLQVFFTASEALGAAPVLVASRPLGAGATTRFTPERQPGTQNYVLDHLVTEADGAGPVTFSAELVDAAGNSATAITVGTSVIDPVAPVISALTVIPDRLGATGTLAVTFDAEEAATGTLVATVGGRALSCGPHAPTSPSYLCTRAMTGSELLPGTEEVQSIVVSLADAAGNRTTASGSVAFDFRAPGLAGRGVEPAEVGVGGVILVSLTPDEELGAAPVLVASRALPEGSDATRFPLVRVAGTRNYQFTHLVDWTDGAGPVDFAVELTDAVGNATTAEVGTTSVDRDPILISSVAAAPARLRATGTLTVRFDTGEAAAPGTLAVTVGGRPMTCTPWSPSTPSYACERPMAGDELLPGEEAAQSIVITLADRAGNRSTASASTVFDFRPPSVVAASVVYEPPAGSAVPSVTRATAGARITVTALASEAIEPTYAPTLAAERDGSALPFVYLAGASTDTSAVFEAVVPPGAPDGAYAATIIWTDLAGNTSASADGVPAVQVKTSLPTLTVNQAAVVFVRSPWGNAAREDLGGYEIPAGAYFALEPPETLSGAPRLAAGTFLLDGGVVPERIQVRAGTMTVGTLRPDAGGTWPRQALASPDTFTVEVVGYDDAGNGSEPQAIGTVEWVATSNLPPTGTTPHTLRRTPRVEASRVQRTEVDGVPEADVGGADAVAAVAVAQEVWRKMSFPPPSGRPILQAPVAYDSARGRVVMFGGRLSSSLLQSTLEWDGRTWLDVTPPSGNPAARFDAALAYDGARGRTVLFGGTVGPSGRTVPTQDTWEWDGTRWEQKAPASSPPPCAQAAMTYDSARARVVLYGGVGCGGDTWEWDGSAWTSITLPPGSPGLPLRPGLAYDPARGRTVLVGGGAGATVWEWDGASWTSIVPAGAAPGGKVITDAHGGAGGRIALLGTVWDGATDRAGVWGWDGASWTTLALPATAPPLDIPAAAYDAARGRVVLNTGQYGALDWTWEWDGAGWTAVTPTGKKPGPGYMYGNALAYDPVRRRSVLWGVNGPAPRDTWEWDGSNWTSVSTAAEGPDGWSGLVYDVSRQRTIAVSGTQTWEWDGAVWRASTPAYQASGPLVYDGTWRAKTMALDNPQAWWDGTTWLTSTEAAHSGLAVFDPGGPAVLVWNSNATEPIWSWDGSGWTSVERGDPFPSRRSSAAMTFDTERGRAVLFGGMGCGSVCQDSWEWDGTRWREVTPPGTKPPARRFHAMTYDSARRRTVLFSGNDIGGDVYWDDTWELEARPTTRPAIQLDVSTARTGISPERIRHLVVRAYAGGAFTIGDAAPTAGAGATLRAWATHSPEHGPGGWIPLLTNDAAAAAAPPYLGPPAATRMTWDAGPTEARRLITERDGQLSVQVVPSGTMGPDPGGARVALDYLEVRIRYAALP